MVRTFSVGSQDSTLSLLGQLGSNTIGASLAGTVTAILVFVSYYCLQEVHRTNQGSKFKHSTHVLVPLKWVGEFPKEPDSHIYPGESEVG